MDRCKLVNVTSERCVYGLQMSIKFCCLWKNVGCKACTCCSKNFQFVVLKVQEMRNVHAILEFDFRPQIRSLHM
ncbi:hypothetical protein BpHYR1_042448 [Brachionus plicatilis]|uniref:Uncharacterized protein n=1 Tax=Brachionus plicatilis TaxID=10195 RepID=A0A3M7QWD1_BRAPC|nr:hypothetical protein BpHYR1_042448 [Brachionus plicatilis]